MRKKAAAKEIWQNGGNRADGTRFEAGEPVPNDLTADERKAFTAMGCIAEAEAEAVEVAEEDEDGDDN